GFLHGKAYIFSTDEGVLAGSSNFTAAGLSSNLELNLGHYQPGLVTRVEDWFDSLWNEAVPYDLASIYQERYEEYDPYLIYLRVLWELYKDDMNAERQPSGRIPLTTFQNDGLLRALRILDQHNGVIVADGVGLGKTFIAGEMMRLVQENRQRVLLISSATLRDGTWERFQKRTQLRFENLSYEQLVQAGPQEGKPEEYELVVVDEAQAFRNPDTHRARALRLLLRGKPPKKLVLMTATPVNNSLWDLYYLMTYFLKHDAVFADKGIRSLKERFGEAQKMDPFDLRPDVLFDVLDPVTVRRTRRFVQRWYPHERIPGPEGTMIPVRFPTPHVDKIEYNLEEVLPEGFFDEFQQALAPEEGDPKLTMARYKPSAFLKEDGVQENEMTLVGLLRSALLKRFESSIYAFKRTTERMTQAHSRFLQAIDAGYVPSPLAMEELTETDSDDAIEELLEEAGSNPVSMYRIEQLRADVQSDYELLKSYADVAASIDRDMSPKLKRLREALLDILGQAEKEAGGDEYPRDNIKVLIFSYYGDTVQWIFDYLTEKIDTDRRLAPYRGRLAALVGDRSLQGDSREATIFGFAPISTEAPERFAKNRFDVLVTTDVLAEGMNLQQSRHIINFDLPWNPMRLVQRHGRIDRIASPHTDVFIKCFLPDVHLDDLLRLERRVRSKLAQAAASIGVESEVIPHGSTGEVTFAETKEQIEALRRGETELFERGDEIEGAHSGEEYRQELRKGLEEMEREIIGLPWGAGSGLANGKQKGWFFCARVGEKVFLRFVPADKELILSDTLGCLRQIACDKSTQRSLTDDMFSGAYDAWCRARKDIFDEWMRATDPKNLMPKIRPLFREIAEHLRNNPAPNVPQQSLEEAVDAVMAPWGVRYERELRPIMHDEATTDEQKSTAFLDKIQELGMSPYSTPEPLPLIDEGEVTLVCWMGVGNR
ncbi:MAG: helicase, partial [candidate division Zixibacteria bacterium]|nr:helicase [candidate division Zixibacteria bacterium]